MHSWVRKYEQSGLAGAGGVVGVGCATTILLEDRLAEDIKNRRAARTVRAVHPSAGGLTAPETSVAVDTPSAWAQAPYGRLRPGGAAGGRHPRPRRGCGIRRRQGSGAHRAVGNLSGHSLTTKRLPERGGTP